MRTGPAKMLSGAIQRRNDERREETVDAREIIVSDAASSDFWDSFTCAGSLVVDCVCGRTHFSTRPDAGTWEDGELEKLLQSAIDKPDRYIPTDDDSVSVGVMDGCPICYGCPCKTAAKYERFILSNESAILDYFRRVAKRKRIEVERSEAALSAALPK